MILRPIRKKLFYWHDARVRGASEGIDKLFYDTRRARNIV